MTPNMDDVREAVAYAICNQDAGPKVGCACKRAGRLICELSRGQADAALSALAAMGLAVVPVEPNRSMVRAAVDADDNRTGATTCIHIYRAMLAASPLAASPDQAAPPAAKDTADE